MTHDRGRLILESGEEVAAVMPVIISASRSTDIPAWYADWFIKRLEKGYLRWINPYNPNRPYYVSFEKTRAIVFWTKNPTPLLKHLDKLNNLGICYYLLYTLNDYEKEQFEPGIPSLDERIQTFIRVSEMIGRDRVIWRFDPVLRTDTLDIPELVERVRRIGCQIAPYTNKLVFSFVDMGYSKVKRQGEQYHFFGLSPDEKEQFIAGIQRCNEQWNLVISTCADEAEYGPEICHNSCIDGSLLRTIGSDDKGLMDFLSKNQGKDKGQRPACRCILSKDIGRYDTCMSGCVYCYATVHERAVMHYEKYQGNPDQEIIGAETMRV